MCLTTETVRVHGFRIILVESCKSVRISWKVSGRSHSGYSMPWNRDTITVMSNKSHCSGFISRRSHDPTRARLWGHWIRFAYNTNVRENFTIAVSRYAKCNLRYAMEGLRNREVHNIVKKEKNSMTRNFFAISSPFSFLKSNGLCYFIAVSSMWLIIN